MKAYWQSRVLWGVKTPLSRAAAMVTILNTEPSGQAPWADTVEGGLLVRVNRRLTLFRSYQFGIEPRGGDHGKHPAGLDFNHHDRARETIHGRPGPVPGGRNRGSG